MILKKYNILIELKKRYIIIFRPHELRNIYNVPHIFNKYNILI